MGPMGSFMLTRMRESQRQKNEAQPAQPPAEPRTPRTEQANTDYRRPRRRFGAAPGVVGRALLGGP